MLPLPTYCPANISIFDFWVDNGTSQCFMDTITSTVLAIYLFIFGLWHSWMYKKYGVLQSFANVPNSKLYRVQMFFTYFLAFLAVVRFYVLLHYTYSDQVYLYMVRTPSKFYKFSEGSVIICFCFQFLGRVLLSVCSNVSVLVPPYQTRAILCVTINARQRS